MAALSVLVVSSLAQIVHAEWQNEMPIIGIAAQELMPRSKQAFPTYSSFIAASYVKAVESAGARVVPIFIDKNDSYYEDLLGSINGVVLPGGAAPHGPGNLYYDAVAKIYRVATEMNKKGVVFPILSVCLGFEFLITVVNDNESFLSRCDVHYENLPLLFTQPYAQTVLFAEADEKTATILSTMNSTVNNHKWCALRAAFENSSLKDDWRVTSLSTSPKSAIEFIATIEHKTLPFFGTQFHPEKAAFEWNKTKSITHSPRAIFANRLFYDTLVKFARLNTNQFQTEADEKRSLIYNYPATQGGAHYEQMYLF